LYFAKKRAREKTRVRDAALYRLLRKRDARIVELEAKLAEYRKYEEIIANLEAQVEGLWLLLGARNDRSN